MDNHNSEDGSKMITLFIKGGVAHTVGDCPLCQRVYMVLKLKDLNFRVMAVNTNAPPTEYKEIAGTKKPPILVDGEIIHNDVAQIVEYLDASYNQVPLQPKDKNSHSVGLDLFLALSKYLKNKDPSKDDRLKQILLKKLQDINDALEIHGGPFLDGEKMTLPDCNLLPKLYHTAVCGKVIKEKAFEIPHNLENIHRYLDAFKASDVFDETKVEEEEIEYGWRKHRML